MTATGVVKYTERSMLNWLHRRYDNDQYVRRGNGIRWVCAEHVRNDSGFYAARTADFMAMDMWPGTGNALHGHEVKVSRSDWLAELRKPEKAIPFIEVVDHWWLVVPDASIVKDGELPVDWGLLVLSPRGLRSKRAAPRLHGMGGTSLAAHRATGPLPRGFTASLVRAVSKTAESQARFVHELAEDKVHCTCGFYPSGMSDQPYVTMRLHICQANTTCNYSSCAIVGHCRRDER